MKTLLATDGSTYAVAALVAAGRLLTHANNRFDVLCIIPDYSPPSHLYARSAALEKWLRTQYRDEMARRTEQVLNDAKRALHDAGVEAAVMTQTGSPADVLVKIAGDYDAVVVGTQSGLERASPGLGPVASRVVEHAAGIVMVGRPMVNEKNIRILLGVDGSSSSENAIDVVRTSFQLRDADVTLMHVMEKPWLRLGLDQGWYSEFERSYAERSEEPQSERAFEAEFSAEARHILEAAEAQLRNRCLSIETKIAEGNPANEILDQAEMGDYDLIVLGATGASDLKHTMLGSVSFKVASYAPCSVAVIR
jgi:nucleotide-binding universal stress UspA family protein